MLMKRNTGYIFKDRVPVLPSVSYGSWVVPLRPDFTSKLVHVLAFGTPKFYIAPYDKIKHKLVNLSSNCDVKSGLFGDKRRHA